jgi:hypothetical protein
MRIPFVGEIDERFLEHRLRSTSVAGMAGAFVAWAAFTWALVRHHVYRWDLLAVIATMAVVKVAFMVFYRRTR